MSRKKQRGCITSIILFPFTFMKWMFILLFGFLKSIVLIIKEIFKALVPNKNMNGYEYEQFVANYLSMHGYHHAKVTQSSGDFGVDVIAHKNGIKYAVQCKYYTGKVGNAAVQEVVAGMNHYSCNGAMVVTNNQFTQAAETLATENGVILMPNVIPGKFSVKQILSAIYTILFILIFIGSLCSGDYLYFLIVFAIGIIPYLFYALIIFIKGSKSTNKATDTIVTADNELSDKPNIEDTDFNDILEPVTITCLDLDKLDEYVNAPIEDSSNTSEEETFSNPKTIIDEINNAKQRSQKEKQKSKTKKEKSIDDIIKRAYEENPVQKFSIIKEEPKQSFDNYKIPNIDLLSHTKSDEQNIIRIYDLLDTFEFMDNIFNVCLGKDYNENNIYCDLIKNPYLLIFGQTGTGKSICMHSIITSILFETKPDEVKLLLIDPKGIEFNKYIGIPHLLVPVVTDTKKSIGALGWAISEMLQRYNRFSDVGVRDIDGYNNYAASHSDIENMPHIMIFVDSLELLILESKKETEDSICRLTTMARTVGMHLIISTQQENILKKANINATIKTEIAFDNDNASEIYQLLYKPSNMNKPIKIKSCFVLDEETSKLCDFIKNQGTTEYNELIQKEIEAKATPYGTKLFVDDIETDYDLLFDKAAEIVIDAGQASTSFLQRKLSIGYARGIKIIDQLQEYGVIGPAEGITPRKVLMTKQMYLEKREYEKGAKYSVDNQNYEDLYD